MIMKRQISAHPRLRDAHRQGKRNRILNLLFRDRQASRFALAQRLALNASMVGRYVEELMADGLVLEEYAGTTRRGRSPVPLRLNPDHGCFLGLDFEALRARAVLTDFAGGILDQKEVPLKPGLGREGVIDLLADLARSLAGKSGDRRMLAVGLAAPGPVDVENGVVMRYPLLPDFAQVPLREGFERRFGAPAFLEHNTRALTFAEMLRGAGRGKRNVLCLTVRSGLAVGIVIDGRVYAGSGGLAGEAGYAVIPTDEGPRTLTELASETGILERARRLLRTLRGTPVRKALLKNGDALRFADLEHAAEAGDDAIRRLLEETGVVAGMMLANFANILSPETVVLVGDAVRAGAPVREALEREFRRRLVPEIRANLTLTDSRLAGFGAALGAAGLGFAKRFPENGDGPVSSIQTPLPAEARGAKAGRRQGHQE